MRYILTLVLALMLLGCEGKVDLSPKKVNWDRDECERCAMMMGDKDFTAQVVSQEDGNTYFFDDIGCAILWLDNAGNMLSLDNVNLYVRNAENKDFIDAKEAVYTTDRISPMSYNFLAHDTKTFKRDGVAYVTFGEVVTNISTQGH